MPSGKRSAPASPQSAIDSSARLRAAVDGVHETVPADVKIPGGAHICVEGVESESLLFLLDEADLCASAASACASGAMEPSHVLAAMGVEAGWAAGALRMTLGRTTTEADADRAVEILTGAISTLRVRSASAAQAAGRS